MAEIQLGSRRWGACPFRGQSNRLEARSGWAGYRLDLSGDFSRANDSEIAFHEAYALTPDRVAQVESVVQKRVRGICPSCNARRMCEVAAHLTDHLLPHAPHFRYWMRSRAEELSGRDSPGRLRTTRPSPSFGRRSSE